MVKLQCTLGKLIDALHLESVSRTKDEMALEVDLVHPEGVRIFPITDEREFNEAENIINTLYRDVPSGCIANALQTISHEKALIDAGNDPTLLDLVRGSEEWNYARNLCGEHLEPVRIQRVHNELLADQYHSHVNRMAKKPGFNSVNERILFHGTAKTDPVLLCLGTEGFDPRLSRHGNYGLGSYFSSTPNYSAKNYGYKCRRDSIESRIDMGYYGEECPSQMIISRVACGNVYDMGHFINQSFTRPPPLSERPHVLHDCVQGGPFSSRSSEMCMVVTYDKAQALPEYIVTFKFGPAFEAANNLLVSLPSSSNIVHPSSSIVTSIPPTKIPFFKERNIAALLELPLIQTPRFYGESFFGENSAPVSPRIFETIFSEDEKQFNLIVGSESLIPTKKRKLNQKARSEMMTASTQKLDLLVSSPVYFEDVVDGAFERCELLQKSLTRRRQSDNGIDY